MKPLLALLGNPVVRAIAKPLLAELVAWVQGKRERPRWLDAAVREVPELEAPMALAELRARARK